MFRLKSCEGCLSCSCGVFRRYSKAASYQADKAFFKASSIWPHLHLKEEIEMKNYRNAAAALALALVFSTSVGAGEIHTDGSPTPSTSNEVMQTGAADGEIHTGQAESVPTATGTLTETALTLLQSLLALI
jgi:hypothetical protein